MSYYSENREKIIQYSREYKRINHEKVLQKKKEYRDDPKNKIKLREAVRRYAKRHPDKIREKNKRYKKNHRAEIYARKYHITVEKYFEFINQSNGKCNICGESIDKINIDHCHKTGTVRGILCRKCNYGLGNFKDSKILLQKAISYLEDN